MTRLACGLATWVVAFSAIWPGVGHARERPPQDTAEGGLWSVSDDAERAARESAQLETDVALNAFLREVTCKVAADLCEEIRIYLMNHPFFNAMMAPNGYSEVWAGLLLRAGNEAEVAFVLGHEIAHFSESHSLKSFQTTKRRATGATILSLGIGLAGQVAINNASSVDSALNIVRAADVLSGVVYIGTLASLFSFSKEQETEADAMGFHRAVAAGYDAGAGATLWSRIIEEAKASDSEQVRKSHARSSIFATHPVSSERLQALSHLASGVSTSAGNDESAYRAVIRPFLGPWLEDDLKRRDFGQTLFLISRLEQLGEDLGLLSFHRGETYRLRRGAGDLERAAEAYAAATQHPDAPPQAWREVGAAHLRSGDEASARSALRRYLELVPQASDRALVEMDLEMIGESDANSINGEEQQ